MAGLALSATTVATLATALLPELSIDRTRTVPEHSPAVTDAGKSKIDSPAGCGPRRSEHAATRCSGEALSQKVVSAPLKSMQPVSISKLAMEMWNFMACSRPY